MRFSPLFSVMVLLIPIVILLSSILMPNTTSVSTLTTSVSTSISVSNTTLPGTVINNSSLGVSELLVVFDQLFGLNSIFMLYFVFLSLMITIIAFVQGYSIRIPLFFGIGILGLSVLGNPVLLSEIGTIISIKGFFGLLIIVMGIGLLVAGIFTFIPRAEDWHDEHGRVWHEARVENARVNLGLYGGEKEQIEFEKELLDMHDYFKKDA